MQEPITATLLCCVVKDFSYIFFLWKRSWIFSKKYNNKKNAQNFSYSSWNMKIKGVLQEIVNQPWYNVFSLLSKHKFNSICCLQYLKTIWKNFKIKSSLISLQYPNMYCTIFVFPFYCLDVQCFSPSSPGMKKTKCQ